MSTNIVRSTGITGLGGYLPRQVVTNRMLQERLDTDHDWIVSRTGITERRFADALQSTSDLAIEAGRLAVQSAHRPKIDALVLATTTPDYRCPATAPAVAARMGLGKIPAFDVGAVCSGFLYAVSVASAYVSAGLYDNLLVIGAEKFSTLIDQNDRATACLFGDGAGAAVVGKVPEGTPGSIHAISLASDGELEDLIRVERGGARYPDSQSDSYLAMHGKQVFSAATSLMAASARHILATAGWRAQDLDWLVAHQANKRILDLVCKSLAIAPEKACLHLDVAGNTAGASIPLALSARASQFAPGEKMVLTAFGAGATWGSIAMTWPDVQPIFVS